MYRYIAIISLSKSCLSDISFQLKWLTAIIKSWNAPKFNLWVPAFPTFPGGMPPNTLALACFACWLYFAQYIVIAYVSTFSIYSKVRCLEILSDQFKIASSAPAIGSYSWSVWLKRWTVQLGPADLGVKMKKILELAIKGRFHMCPPLSESIGSFYTTTRWS